MITLDPETTETKAFEAVFKRYYDQFGPPPQTPPGVSAKSFIATLEKAMKSGVAARLEDFVIDEKSEAPAE